MPRRNHRIIVIGKVREFDEEAWKRLLMAYAYYLHEQHMEQTSAVESTSPKDPGSEIQAGEVL